MRVDGGEVTSGASREPTTERGELERLREVTKRETVLRKLRLQHRALRARLNARGQRAPLHLDDAIEAPEVEAQHSLVAIIDLRFDATHHAGPSAERNDSDLCSARPVENVADLRFACWTRNQIRSGGEVTPETAHHVAIVATVGMPDPRLVTVADRMREASWRLQTRSVQLDRIQGRRLIEPLGMTRTRFEVRDPALEDVSRGFVMDGSTLVEVPRCNLDAIGPAGSIESSARDLSRWIALHLNHGRVGERQLIPAEALAALYEEQIEIELTGVNTQYAIAYPTADRVGYGLGWFRLERDGLIVLEHGGGIDGFSSVVGFVPALRTGYVVLQNTESQDSVLSMAIREHLLDLLTGTKRGDWGPDDMGLRGQTLNLSEDPAG